MRIGEVAKRAGVSTSKIRFYEVRGLLPQAARTPSGYRDYDATDLHIVGFINRGRALGFSLEDIARFMAQPVAERRAKTTLIPALEAKLSEVDAHLAEVQARRTAILALIDEVKPDHRS
jgi:MerR family copper efflux transcriptional regulator